MEEYQKKRRVKKVIYSVPSAILLFVLSVLIARGAWNLLWKERDTARELGVSNAELTKIKEKEKMLQASIVDLQTDRGIEAEVRSRFNVVKEDERLFVVVDSASATEPVKEKSFWEKVGNFFGFTSRTK